MSHHDKVRAVLIDGPATRMELMLETGLDRETVHQSIGALRRLGHVQRVDGERVPKLPGVVHGPLRVVEYQLTPQGKAAVSRKAVHA